MIYWKVFLVLLLQVSCQIWDDDQQEHSEMEVNSGESSPDSLAEGESAEAEKESVEEDDDDDDDDETPWVEALRSQVKDMRLDQSRLWSKIESLESVVRSLKEQTHLLRKGLMTGIAPIGLSEAPDMSRDPLMMDDDMNEQMHDVSIKESQVSRDREGYARRYAKARQLFQEANYGKAYLEFVDLKKLYSAEVHKDEPLYWIGRCWALLQDYPEAKKSFEMYLKQQANTPWVAATHLELAKVEMKIGSQTAAVHRLKKLLQKYPYEASSEEARMILGSLDHKL